MKELFKDRDIIATRENKLIYKEDDSVVKVFDLNFKKSDILNEALNQARVEETGLLVPKVLEVLKIGPYWAIRSEFVPGKTLEQIMQEDKGDEDKYLDRFLQIQLDIFEHESPLLNDLQTKMKRKINESSFNATIRYDLHMRLNSMPKHRKICHGDYNPSNIIITPDDEAYVLDWSHVTQGNASADAALTYLLMQLEGQEELAEKYLNLFCEKTDTAKQYVQEWMPIVAASQSTKNKANEKEFLTRWVDVMDFQ